MRTLLSLAPACMILAFVAIPAEACAQAPPLFEGEYPHCPTYDLASAGVDGARLEVNAFGQFLLTFLLVTGTGNEIMYQTWDEPSLFDGGQQFTFSMWTYQEANGLPGLQRGDDVCNNTPAGHFSDTTIC